MTASASGRGAPRPGAWHAVRQGESVESIAAATGHLSGTIRDAPENADLRARRREMHVLMPGDRIYVPPVAPSTFTVRTGIEKRFRVARPPSRLRIQLVKEGKPRAGEPFALTVDGVEERGTTDGSGFVDRPVSPLAAAASLVVGEGEGAATYLLQLRALDPVEEVSGVQGRLRNLGYDVGHLDGALDDRTRAAIAAFQGHESLAVTGEADEPTRARLKERHGS